VVGAVLIVGMVWLGAMVAVTLGTSVLTGETQRVDTEQAGAVLQDVDAELATLTRSSDESYLRVDFGATNPQDFTLVRDGWLSVTVNDNPACAARLNLSSIRFQTDSGSEVAYEAGGVWRRGSTGGSTMVTSPSVTYTDGTVGINLVNVTGGIDQSVNEVRLDEGSSQADTYRIDSRLTSGDCARPNNLTLSVRSDFYRGWQGYLDDEFAGSIAVDDDNRTVSVSLGQSDLTPRANDSRNAVVNLTSGAYNSVAVGPDNITVDKGINRTFRVTAVPLRNGSLGVGNITEVRDDSQVGRRPIDVAFVLDESGSMGNDDGDTLTRSEEAQRAAKSFVADLNASMDRAAVVSYDTSAEYRETTAGEYLSGDFSAAGVNGSIDAIPDNPGGGTVAHRGVSKANAVLGLRSDASRKQVIILMTDGVNDDCQTGGSLTDNDDAYDCEDNKETIARVQNAAASGVTVYSVGYGGDSQIDEAFLEEVAEEGGGEFKQATDADELEDVFDEIRRAISETRIVAKSPLSGNLSAAGSVYPPQSPGANRQVARFRVAGQNFSNINDPSTPSPYSYIFTVEGGEEVTMEAYDYDCADDAWVGTGRSVSYNGSTFRVARCTDIESSDPVAPTEIYLDGADLSSTPLLTTDYDDVWQADIKNVFARYDDITLNATSGEVDLQSNQALVYYDLPDGPESENYLLLLYEIGVAESDARAAGTVNVVVSNVRFSG
jgi:Mg-chelatase subunit ChlD